MASLGVERMFVEVASGAGKPRPVMEQMIDFVREGDIVVVESISRFARNAKDLLEYLSRLEKKGVAFVSQKETLDTSTPAGRFMLNIFGAVSQLEHEYLLARQKEGIALAVKEGKYRGRRPLKIDAMHWDSVFQQWRAGHLTAVKAASRLNISLSTFYRRLKTVNN